MSQQATMKALIKNGKLFLKNGKLYLRTKGTPNVQPQTPPDVDANEFVFLDGTEPAAQNLLETLTTNNYGPLLLSKRQQLFEKIAAGQELNGQVLYFAFYAVVFSAIYGALLGMYAGSFQILAGALKFPCLLFGTLLLCLPALYMFNTLAGSTLSFRQTLIVLLGATYLMSILLASLSPILVFFILNTTSSELISLIALLTCGASGLFALNFAWKGIHSLSRKQDSPLNPWIMRIWVLVYALVGTQLSWGLRPFIGQKGDVTLFRGIAGNFYSAVFELCKNLFSGLF